MNIAIIIINYRTDSQTINCINSILNSTVENLNININILDNNPLNKSILKSYIKSCSLSNNNIIFRYYVSRKNIGFAKGANFLIKKLKNLDIDFFYFLNNDCLIKKDSILEIVNKSKNNPKIIYSSLIYDFNNKIWFEGGTYNSFFGTTKHCKYKEFKQSKFKFLTGCALLLSNKAIEQIGHFKEFFLYGEDLDFSLKAVKLGYNLDICHKSVVFHEVGASTNKKSFIAYKNYVSGTLGAFYCNYGLFKQSLITIFYLLKFILLNVLFFNNLKNNLGFLSGIFIALKKYSDIYVIIKFILMGSAVAIFALLLNIILVEIFLYSKRLSFLLAFIPTTLLSYILQGLFTFNSKIKSFKKTTLYLVQTIFGIIFSYFFYIFILQFNIDYKISLLLTYIANAVLSFLISKFLIFTK